MFILQAAFWASVLISVSSEVNFMFLNELLSHSTFQSPKFNVIICSESENINLIKVLSRSFQRFVVVCRADKPLRPFSDELQTFVLDLNCPKAKAVLQQADDLRLFSKPFQWLLLSNNENCRAKNQSEKLSILLDSDVKIIENISSQATLVTGVYKLQSTLLKESLARWTSGKGLTVLNSKVIAIRRWNLQGVVLPSSMIVLHQDGVTALEDSIDDRLDTTTKICFNVIKLYEDLFNASISVKMVKDWGVFVNGSWTGMVGDFERKEIEIGGSPLFFQKQRMDFIEYYETVTPNGITFIFLSPPLSYSNNIFAMPFDVVVWYCCLAMVVVSCFLLFAALKYEKSYFKNNEDATKNESKISFTEIVIVNIGAICLQGTAAKTKNPASRIITLFLYLSYMFLYISYSGSIVAILQSSDKSIQTLSDFLKSPLEAGAEDVTYSRHYFEVAEEKVRKSLYSKKIAPQGEPSHFLPVEEGIRKVRKGFYGFHVELTAGYEVIQKTFTEEEKCAVQELKETFFLYIEPWLVMKKKSPYSELIKIGVKKCIETGFKNRFVRRFYTRKPICSSKSSRFVSVGITECYYAFMLLSYGFVIAFLIMILEIIFFKFLKQREKRIMVPQSLLVKKAKEKAKTQFEFFI